MGQPPGITFQAGLALSIEDLGYLFAICGTF